MRYFLGVDGSGTKTEAVLMDEKQRVLGRGYADGCLISVYGHQKSVNNLYLAVEKALSGKKLQGVSSCLALAGVDTRQDSHQWKQIVKDHPKLSKILSRAIIVNDTLAALRAGTTEQDALVLIAGTGSNCYGRSQNGQEARSGGAGHILGDQGSAYDIGLSILKIITKNLDGRGPDTILTTLFFEMYKINSLEELIAIVNQKPWDKVDIAQVAPLAEKASEAGDSVAAKIIEDSAHELAIMGKAVVTKLKMREKSYTAVLSGSVFNIQNILNQKLHRELLEFSPKVKFVKPSMSSAEAAANLAMDFSKS